MNEEDIFSNESNVYYGHGIGANNQEVIESIFNNGLRCSHNQLYFTTVTFGPGSSTLFKEKEELINNWPHQASKQIIIASLPQKFHLLDIIGTPLYGKGQAAFYNFVSKEQSQELGITQGFYLKPEFVMGMYDADKKEFVSNERYYENLPEEEQKRLMDEIKGQYMDILKESGWSFSEYSQVLKENNIENPLTNEEIEKGDRELFDSQMLETQLHEMTNASRISDFDETMRSIKEDAEQGKEEKENADEGWSVDDDW